MSNIYKIKIDGKEIKNLYQGASLIERIDEEFDEFRTVQFASKHAQPYQMGAKVEVIINGVTNYYVVSKDEVDLFARSPLCYSHTIELKEETELLNHRVAEALGFYHAKGKSISVLDAIERYRRIVPFERKDLHETTRLFTVSESLKEKLATKESLPELVLSEGLIFDQLSQISQLVDSVPYLENGELDFIEFNKRGKEIKDSSNIVDIRSYHDLTNYITDVIAFLSNGTIDHVGYSDTPRAFTSPRSEDVVLSDNGSQLILKYPIKEIVRVELVCKVTTSFTADWNETNSFHASASTFATEKYKVVRRGTDYGVFDITNHVVPIQKFRTLSSEVDTTILTKANCLYYSYGSKTIEGVGDTFTRYKLLMNIETNASENLIKSIRKYVGENSISSTDGGPRNYMFRVTYYPLISGRVKMKRPNEDNSVQSDIIVGQSAATVDLGKQGRMLLNLAKRLGHADKTVFRIFENYEKVNLVGDYLSDGYIITAVEHVIYRDYVFSIEQYNKHYNRRSMYVGLNQEPRPFSVSDTVVKRLLNYTEKVVISSEKISRTDSLMTYSGKCKFEEMFKQTHNMSTLDSVAITCYDKEGNKENGSSSIFLPVVANEFGNTLLLSFELESQTSAGDQVTESGDRRTLSPVTYVNSDGGAYYLDLSFGSAAPIIDLAPEYIVDDLPYNNNNVVIGGRTWPRGLKYSDDQVTASNPAGNTFEDYQDFGRNMYYWFQHQRNNYVPKIYYVKSTRKYYRSILLQIDKLAQQPCYEGIYNGEYLDTWAYYEAYEELDPALYRLGIDGSHEKAQNLPEITGSSLDSWISTNDNTRFVLDKNVAEKVAMTYQLSIESDSDDIIIGDYFIKNNHMVTRLSDEFSVWISNEAYGVSESKEAKGEKCDSNIIIGEDHSLMIDYDFESNSLIKAWAIATDDGKLILACNVPVKKVYFNYLNK